MKNRRDSRKSSICVRKMTEKVEEACVHENMHLPLLDYASRSSHSLFPLRVFAAFSIVCRSERMKFGTASPWFICQMKRKRYIQLEEEEWQRR